MPVKTVLNCTVNPKSEILPELSKFNSYVEDCVKFNDAVKEQFDSMQKQLGDSNSRESAVKRKIDEEVSRSKKRENESLRLIQDLKDGYDHNMTKLRQHHKNQITGMLAKHNLEIQKWKSKYEKLKKADKIKVDDAVHHSTLLQTQLDKTKTELKELQSKYNMCNNLRSQLTEAKTKITQLEEKLSEEKKLGNDRLAQIEHFERDITKKKSALDSKDGEIMKFKAFAAEAKNTRDLTLKDLNELKRNEKKWKDKCADLEKKSQLLRSEIECIKRKNDELTLKIEQISAEKDKLRLEKNKLGQPHEELKNKCKVLESQVDCYSQKLTDAKIAQKSLQEQKCSLSDERSILLANLSSMKEKIAQLEVEKEEMINQLNANDWELNSLITDEKSKFSELHHEFELNQDRCQQLEDHIRWLEDNSAKGAIKLTRLKQDRLRLNEQLSSIKEEYAKHITKISFLEKERNQLLDELDIKREYEKALEDKISIMKDHFKEKSANMIREKLSCEETFSKQMQIIIGLIENQKQLEDNKKKGSIFPTNLTPGSKRVSLNCDQKYFCAKEALNIEKMKNVELNKQLNYAKGQLKANLNEVQKITTELNELQQYFRQNREQTNCSIQNVRADCQVQNNFCISPDKMRESLDVHDDPIYEQDELLELSNAIQDVWPLHDPFPTMNNNDEDPPFTYSFKKE